MYLISGRYAHLFYPQCVAVTVFAMDINDLSVILALINRPDGSAIQTLRLDQLTDTGRQEIAVRLPVGNTHTDIG